jgi:hypothetical protein
MNRLAKWFRCLISRCDYCGRFGALTYHQRTQYENPAENIVTLCPACKERNDEYWDERWADYYSDIL